MLNRRFSFPIRRRSGEGSSGSGSSGGGMSGSSSGKGRRRGGGGGGGAEAGTPHLPRVASSISTQQASPSQALPLAPSPSPNVAPALPSAAPTSNHGSQEEGMGLSGAEEDVDVYLPSVSYLTAPNGSGSGPGSSVSVGLVGDTGWPSPTPPPASSSSADDVDYGGSIAGGSLCTATETPDASRTRAAIEHMHSKIRRTKELIRGEQTTSDDNVNEYLKLAANADRQQLGRIKAVFEKKNQKSAHAISQLQKKLEAYTRRVREIEMHGLPPTHHRQPREVLRDMGQGLKTVMSKPREFAHLIKNKFGSADNINTLARNGGEGGMGGGPGEDDVSGGGGGSGRSGGRTHHGSATLPGQGSSSSGAIGGVGKFPSEEEEGATVGGDGSGGGGPLGGSECSSVTSESLPPTHHGGHPCSPRHQHPTPYQLDLIFTELQERREECERLREEMESLKRLQGEVAFLGQSLQEERFRSERLEEQVNDLTELHQVEVENLKQAISDVEEKVQYQSEERLRDIHEMLESCHTKIFKLEHQQQQQQQYVTLEGIENGNARALVVKLINVVLTVLQVVLLVVATAAGIMTPFLKTRLRILTTSLFIAGIVFVLKQWPEMREVGGHLVRRLRDALAVK